MSRRVSSEPWAFGFLAALAVLLLAMIAIESGCYLPAPRWPVEQSSFAVEVNAFCLSSDPFGGRTHVGMWKGSGAILNSRRVLTVQHVVDCDYLFDGHVGLLNGQRIRVRVAWQSKDLDIAALEPVAGADSFTSVDEPTVVKPAIGMHVCAETSLPIRWRLCGKVDKLDDLGTNSDVHFVGDSETDNVEHGNSGSPMYDDYGRLVCVVTRLSSLGGGWCTSVHSHRDLLQH